VQLRPVAAGELEQTAAVWLQMRDELPATAPCVDVAELLVRIEDRMAASDRAVEREGDPTYALTLALDDGTPVGLSSVSVVDQALFSVARSVQVDALYVAPGHRRFGVGRALLEDAVRFAAARGAEQLEVRMPANARALNRFFSGWGFTPGVGNRTASVPALARRLGLKDTVAPVPESLPTPARQRLLRRRVVLGGRTHSGVRVAR
jgi:GNAT superfamily N-acetyltransferase